MVSAKENIKKRKKGKQEVGDVTAYYHLGNFNWKLKKGILSSAGDY